MSRNPSVRIVIQPDGACTVDAINFRGPSCKQVTLEIAQALSVQIEHQHEKPEARLGERTRQADQEAGR